MLLGINTHQYLLRLLVQMYTLIVSTVLIFTLPEYSRCRTLSNWKMGFAASYHSYHSYHSSRVHQMKMELQDLEELGNGSRSFSVPNVSLVSMNHSFTFEMFLWKKVIWSAHKYQISDQLCRLSPILEWLWRLWCWYSLWIWWCFVSTAGALVVVTVKWI